MEESRRSSVLVRRQFVAQSHDLAPEATNLLVVPGQPPHKVRVLRLKLRDPRRQGSDLVR